MFVDTSRLPIFGSIPLLLNAGLLLLLDSSGKIVQTKLETYGFLGEAPEQEYTLDDAIDRLSKAILMKRFFLLSFFRLGQRTFRFAQVRRRDVLGQTTERQ